MLNIILDKIQEFDDPDQISQAYLAQPLDTAIQIALIDLLGSWNIKAAVFIDHSSGRSYFTYDCGKIQLTPIWARLLLHMAPGFSRPGKKL